MALLRVVVVAVVLPFVPRYWLVVPDDFSHSVLLSLRVQVGTSLSPFLPSFLLDPPVCAHVCLVWPLDSRPRPPHHDGHVITWRLPPNDYR